MNAEYWVAVPVVLFIVALIVAAVHDRRNAIRYEAERRRLLDDPKFRKISVLTGPDTGTPWPDPCRAPECPWDTGKLPHFHPQGATR